MIMEYILFIIITNSYYINNNLRGGEQIDSEWNAPANRARVQIWPAITRTPIYTDTHPKKQINTY